MVFIEAFDAHDLCKDQGPGYMDAFSRGGFELSPLMPGTQSEIDILSIINFYLVKP